LNALDRKIERVLEDLVEVYRYNLRMAEESLAAFRAQHHQHKRRLTALVIGFSKSTQGGHMAATAGPVTLTTVGQTVTARIVRYLDQNGQPMPSDFTPPLVSYSIDDKDGAIVKAVDNGDNTATITDVADGVATLTAKTKSAEGLDISASQTITVSNGTPPPPPTPVLTSIELGFE